MKVWYLFLLLAGLAELLVFLATFAFFTDWSATRLGRLTMASNTTWAGLFLMAVVGLFFHVYPWIWIGGFMAFDAVMAGQVLMLWHLQHVRERLMARLRTLRRHNVSN